MIAKLKNLYRMAANSLYKQETGFLLNYLTLKIEDKEVAQQLRNHRTQ